VKKFFFGKTFFWFSMTHMATEPASNSEQPAACPFYWRRDAVKHTTHLIEAVSVACAQLHIRLPPPETLWTALQPHNDRWIALEPLLRLVCRQLEQEAPQINARAAAHLLGKCVRNGVHFPRKFLVRVHAAAVARLDFPEDACFSPAQPDSCNCKPLLSLLARVTNKTKRQAPIPGACWLKLFARLAVDSPVHESCRVVALWALLKLVRNKPPARHQALPWPLVIADVREWTQVKHPTTQYTLAVALLAALQDLAQRDDVRTGGVS
jgi:hypothetical protein